jgi:hypothetical protein
VLPVARTPVQFRKWVFSVTGGARLSEPFKS